MAYYNQGNYANSYQQSAHPGHGQVQYPHSAAAISPNSYSSYSSYPSYHSHQQSQQNQQHYYQNQNQTQQHYGSGSGQLTGGASNSNYSHAGHSQTSSMNPFSNSKQGGQFSSPHQQSQQRFSAHSYHSGQSQQPPPYTPSQTTSVASGTPRYSTNTSSTSNYVSYPSYSYQVSASAGYIYGYSQTTPTNPTNQQGVRSSSGDNNNDSVTPAQHEVIKNWIAQKTVGPAGVMNNKRQFGGGRSRFSQSTGASQTGASRDMGAGNKDKNRRYFNPNKQPFDNYYCDVCKVGCSTSENYNTHLGGKAHKKKANKPMPSVPSSGKIYQCEICDVLCTGKDAFDAHIIGAKHKKVIKLYERLGKTIPILSGEPIDVSKLPGIGVQIQKTGAPLIKFIKGAKGLNTTTKDDTPDKTIEADQTESAVNESTSEGDTTHKKKNKKRNRRKLRPEDRPLSSGLEGFYDGYNIPVYHINPKDNPTPVPQFDQWGRPDRNVDVYFTQCAFKRNKFDDYSILDLHRRIYPMDKELEALYGTMEDIERAIGIISDQLCEESKELAKKTDVVKMESSDKISEIADKMDEIKPKSPETAAVTEANDKTTPAEKDTQDDNNSGKDYQNDNSEKLKVENVFDYNDEHRILQGVQRIGDAVKTLVLHDCLRGELVLMCSVKPSRELLMQVASGLPAVLQTVSDYKYDVTVLPEISGLKVFYSNEEEKINACITITLTSLQMREMPQESADETAFNLNKQSCQQALCQMRRTKWFQAEAFNLPSFILTLRILKDICRRVPAWNCLDPWIIELLVHRNIISSPPEFTRPGDILRKVVACISAGCFLPGAPGLFDPCEKEKVDASSFMTPQQREDITFSAQHALRLISFKQLHKVLGLDSAPELKDFSPANLNPRPETNRRYIGKWRGSRDRPKRKSNTTPDGEKKTKIDGTGETENTTSGDVAPAIPK